MVRWPAVTYWRWSLCAACVDIATEHVLAIARHLDDVVEAVSEQRPGASAGQAAIVGVGGSGACFAEAAPAELVAHVQTTAADGALQPWHEVWGPGVCCIDNVFCSDLAAGCEPFVVRRGWRNGDGRDI